MPEIIRMVQGTPDNDKFNVATPANWQPGDKVVVPAQRLLRDGERPTEGYECKDWYLCFKKSVSGSGPFKNLF